MYIGSSECTHIGTHIVYSHAVLTLVVASDISQSSSVYLLSNKDSKVGRGLLERIEYAGFPWLYVFSYSEPDASDLSRCMLILTVHIMIYMCIPLPHFHSSGLITYCSLHITGGTEVVCVTSTYRVTNLFCLFLNRKEHCPIYWFPFIWWKWNIWFMEKDKFT